jgi:hypothetical protein
VQEAERGRLSLRAISAELATRGILNERAFPRQSPAVATGLGYSEQAKYSPTS